jgi:hypothetical protein
MNKRWIAVNLLLLALAGLLGLQLKSSVLGFKQNNNLNKIQPSGQAGMAKVVSFPQTNQAAVNPADFSMIPEKNVFVESRSKEEPPPVQIGPPEPPPLSNPPILVGTFIADSEKAASIIDPSASAAASSKKSRQIQTKHIGDVYQGYTITDITSEHMVLQGGSKTVTVKLHEGIKRGQAGKTAITASRVIAFGGSSSAGGVAPGGGFVVGGVAMPGGATTVPVGTPVTARGSQPAATSAPIPANIMIQPSGNRGGFTIQTQPAGTTGSRTITIQTPTGRGSVTVPSPFGDLPRQAR